MSSESEARKSMDDVLASIRRIIRGTREAVEAGTGDAEPAPGATAGAAAAMDADGDGVLTLTASRPAGAGDTGSRDMDAGSAEDEALVLGAVPETAQPSGGAASAGADGPVPRFGEDDDVTDRAAGTRSGLSLVSSADWDRATDDAGPSLHGGLEADLDEAPASSSGDALDIGGPGGDPLEPEEIARPHWGRSPLAGEGEDLARVAEEAETVAEEAGPREDAEPDMPEDSWMPAPAAEAPAEAGGDMPGGVPEAVAALDPAALEETIRRVLREELEGEMGLRLSRNIQRMIRDEIARATRDR